MFVDRAKINIKSGRGGNGCVSFRREPFVPEGGPDGGDGGKGGDIVFQANTSYRTLMDFRYKKKYEAPNGEDGRSKKKSGKSGEDLVIMVPPGTLIIDEATGMLMKDLREDGERFVAARGGRGGKGNTHFKNSVRQAPNFGEAGGRAKERTVILELKLIADVGLVGFPNVGKSTLLSAATSANPKIGNYHFTTLTPNLGVVQHFDETFVMADIPGLIEGASEGAGLGLDFLKHIERTRIILHLVDVSGSEGRDPITDFETINKELAGYSEKLAGKKQIVVGSKADMITDQDAVDAFKKHINSLGLDYYEMCAPINMGVREVLNAASKALAEIEIDDDLGYEQFDFDRDDSEDPDYRDVYGGYDDEDECFVLYGKQLEKIFDSTNFTDIESLRYLYKYVEDKGAIEMLKELGLEEGDTIRIKDYDFTYTED